MLIRRTPVSSVDVLGIGRVHFKLENLQRTGSFKLRGAARKLASIASEAHARGVITASAGNHGAGLALAASAAGIAVTVIVSEQTPANKRARIASLGAAVEVAGAGYDEAQAVARARAAESGAIYVPAYDDDDIIAGNGEDLAHELLAQVPDVARVIVPVGGGGLIGGMGKVLAPRGVSVVGAQPSRNCAMHDSLAAGRALVDYAGEATLAEGCEGAVAERTYRLARAHVERIVLVDEAAIRAAIAFCYQRVATIVEASAAVAVAAVLEGEVSCAERGATVCVLTGGNIEPALLDEILVEHG